MLGPLTVGLVTAAFRAMQSLGLRSQEFGHADLESTNMAAQFFGCAELLETCLTLEIPVGIIRLLRVKRQSMNPEMPLVARHGEDLNL